jgi:hypothetical protein
LVLVALNAYKTIVQLESEIYAIPMALRVRDLVVDPVMLRERLTNMINHLILLGATLSGASKMLARISDALNPHNATGYAFMVRVMFVA